MSADSPLDGLFLTAAQRCGGIEPLLAEFFSFLHRRTDFYVVDPNPKRPMGFPEGAAEKMVLKAMKSLPFKHVPAAKSSAAASLAKSPSSRTSARAPTAAIPASVEVPEAKERVVSESTPVGGAGAAAAPPIGSQPSLIRYSDDGKQIPIGNGGIGPNYWWTQTLTELTVYLDVPGGVSSKDVTWDVATSRVSLGLKSRPTEPLLCGELGGTVHASECIWSVEDGKTLVLSFEKAVETWWPSVVKGHPEIDTQQVDSTKKVEDYDPETQAALRKIMFDQAQKAKGLPTSEDIEKERLLAQAMAAPGSPFSTPK